MSYQLQYTEQAADDFLRLPTQLASELLDQLEDLARSPSQFASKAKTPPYPPGRMIFEFRQWLDHRLHLINVLFKYHVDEKHIVILSIGHVEYGPPV